MLSSSHSTIHVDTSTPVVTSPTVHLPLRCSTIEAGHQQRNPQPTAALWSRMPRRETFPLGLRASGGDHSTDCGALTPDHYQLLRPAIPDNLTNPFCCVWNAYVCLYVRVGAQGPHTRACDIDREIGEGGPL